MGALTIFAVKWAQQALPQFQAVGGVVATLISGGFLLLLATINFVILKDIVKTFKSMRSGTYIAESAERPDKGFINRTINRLFNLVSKNSHIYLVGFLFGLGFDTATRMAFFASRHPPQPRAYHGLQSYLSLFFFTAGMSMMDTLDGFFMSTAYQWVLTSPLRKVYYNITITGLSILAAGVIGIIEVGQVFAQESNRNSGFWLWLQNLDFNKMGFMLVGMFILVWSVSLIGWKMLKLDQKRK